METIIRQVYIEDLNEIAALIQASVHGLQKNDYD